MMCQCVALPNTAYIFLWSILEEMCLGYVHFQQDAVQDTKEEKQQQNYFNDFPNVLFREGETSIAHHGCMIKHW